MYIYVYIYAKAARAARPSRMARGWPTGHKSCQQATHRLINLINQLNQLEKDQDELHCECVEIRHIIFTIMTASIVALAAGRRVAHSLWKSIFVK